MTCKRIVVKQNRVQYLKEACGRIVRGAYNPDPGALPSMPNCTPNFTPGAHLQLHRQIEGIQTSRTASRAHGLPLSKNVL